MAEDFLYGVSENLAKTEAAYGTDPVPVPATDAFMPIELKITSSASEEEIKRVRETWAAAGSRTHAVWQDVAIKLPLSGPSAAAVTHQARVPFKACGWKETTDGPPITKIEYTPLSATLQSCTIYQYLFKDAATAELLIATGCVFAPKLSVNGDGEAVWDLTGKGLYNPPTTVARPASAALIDESDGSLARGATITLGALDTPIESVEIDFGVSIVDRKDLNGTYGMAGFALKRGQPTITLTTEARTTTDFDLDADALDETLLAFSMELLTPSGGQWTFEAPECDASIRKIEMGDLCRAVIVLHPRDTVGGDGDDSINFYCEHV